MERGGKKEKKRQRDRMRKRSGDEGRENEKKR